MDIGSLYTDYYSKVASDSTSSKLASASSKDLSGSTDEELMEVCKDFESYFVEQVLKQAMDTFASTEESESGAMNTLTGYYKDSLVKEYASTITEKQDMGLAKTLYDQMKRNYSAEQVPKAEETSTQNAESGNAESDNTSAIEAASTLMSEEND